MKRLRLGAALHFLIAIGHIGCLFALDEAFEAYGIREIMHQMVSGHVWMLYGLTIGLVLEGGSVPDGMRLFPIRNGKWLKVHFEGGMKAFQQQFQKFYKEWLPQHPEFHCPNNAMTMEWYNGTDIESPDYQCGVMIPLSD